MDKLIRKLKDLSKEINLNERYLFDFDHNIPLFNEGEIRRLNNTGSIFQKNVELKIILNEKLKTKPTNEIHFWIINDWGRIKSFKNTENNKKKIDSFLSDLSKGKTARTNFQVISSLSKIASLYDLKDYAIYDSRVIYSLNWLLLRYGNAEVFFPTPAARNKIEAFSLN
ncbi:MAG: hypothetical protein ACW99L_15085 [Promethearchaeota archaeon]|jgi:hypothetical protein